MSYALERLEKSINQHVITQTTTHDTQQIQIILAEINFEKEEIKKHIQTEVFSFKKDKRLELFIQQYQCALIRLANDVFNAKNKEVTTFNRLSENYLQVITELLFFIENHFTRYFNLDEKIPDSYRFIMQAKCMVYVKAIKKIVLPTGDSEEILQIVIDVFNDFIKASSQKTYTYTQVIYFKKLYSEILDCSQFPIENCKQIILDRLLYLNFNSAQFINKYVQHIMLQVADASTIKDQLEVLAWWLKTIKQSTVKPGMSLLIKATSAHLQLIGWLQDEIHFLEKKNQLTLLLPTPVSNNIIPKQSFKTELTVKQLGLFIRLLVDVKIVQIDNQKELVNHIAAFTKTENQESISAQSLRRYYYAIDENTKDKMKDWFIKMINQIRKYE